LAVAQGAGVLRAGAIEVSAEHEAQLALFVQQAIIPAFHHIMVTASELLIGQGIPPEAAFADLHIAGRFFDYLLQANRDGLMPTLLQQPLIAQYAALSRMARFSELRLERMMDDALRDIRGGAFAKEWLREQEEGLVRLNRLRKQENERPVWDYEQQTLDLMRDA
jgi:ketol-acid reductoisomerase